MASSLRGRLRRARNGAHKRLARALVPHLVRVDAESLTLRPVGEGEGAWSVPVDLIRPGWVCYCAGVGVNATFDVQLARSFGCTVVSLDPTPRSIAYMEELDYPRDRLRFLPVGVWNQEVALSFFAPANPRHSNWSVVDLHGTGEYFTADCKRLSVIMRQLEHTHLDLLKLDIEGAWATVLDNILEEGLLPFVLCVEFDSPVSLLKLLRYVRRLRARGLRVVDVERENFVFVHESRLRDRKGASV
jgi:FkbM family methyltransferase